jgi:hypothetical protein
MGILTSSDFFEADSTALMTILSLAVRADVSIFWRIGVSVFADRFVAVPDRASVQINLSGYSLKMIRVNAASHAAKVVGLQALRYWAFIFFIGVPVRQLMPAKKPVPAGIQWSEPDPAAAHGLRYVPFRKISVG